jgi:hypothetical protein
MFLCKSISLQQPSCLKNSIKVSISCLEQWEYSYRDKYNNALPFWGSPIFVAPFYFFLCHGSKEEKPRTIVCDAILLIIAGKNGHFLNCMNVQAKSFHVIGFPASALPKNWEKSPYVNLYLPGNYVM